MAAEHTAHASWQGDLMSGSGTVSTAGHHGQSGRAGGSAG